MGNGPRGQNKNIPKKIATRKNSVSGPYRNLKATAFDTITEEYQEEDKFPSQALKKFMMEFDVTIFRENLLANSIPSKSSSDYANVEFSDYPEFARDVDNLQNSILNNIYPDDEKNENLLLHITGSDWLSNNNLYSGPDENNAADLIPNGLAGCEIPLSKTAVEELISLAKVYRDRDKNDFSSSAAREAALTVARLYGLNFDEDFLMRVIDHNYQEGEFGETYEDENYGQELFDKFEDESCDTPESRFMNDRLFQSNFYATLEHWAAVGDFTESIIALDGGGSLLVYDEFKAIHSPEGYKLVYAEDSAALHAIADYMADAGEKTADGQGIFTGNGYQNINGKLLGRTVSADSVASIDDTIQKLDDMFTHPRARLKEDKIVYRTTWNDFHADNPNYLSTSLKSDACGEFGRILHALTVPAGTPALCLSANENELLLPRGAHINTQDILEKGTPGYEAYITANGLEWEAQFFADKIVIGTVEV